jgi:arginase
MPVERNIQVITAPSILGLRPTGVENLASTLLSNGLIRTIRAEQPTIEVPTLNHLYNERRTTGSILNAEAIKNFSVALSEIIQAQVSKEKFLLVLGGDCSILIGVMLALKSKGSYGLFFVDGHADFYDAETSITGEAADMDLGLVTGRGPDILTNVNGVSPYVKDQNVVHLGQRDVEETIRYNSPDIRNTKIACFDVSFIREHGVEATIDAIEKRLRGLALDGYWIHFDTDVIEHESNPAVDYPLPGGLSIKECETLLTNLIANYNIIGMTLTIYNPTLDAEGKVAQILINLMGKVLH